jgi:hypothetical protein
MAPGILIKKLLIKPSQRIAILSAPAVYLDELGALPVGLKLVAKPHGCPPDFVGLFVKEKAELKKMAAGVLDILKPDAIFWVSRDFLEWF